ncbi:MAG: ATP-binding protein [Candidatus Gastranaerophilales bacterium]|nr:ATP-binding protein [Candidatus Gastranaerophilales bacterium]
MPKFFKEIFFSSNNEIFILHENGEIISMNSSAVERFSNLKNIYEINHLLNFEICILQSDEIMTYTPLYACLNSNEPFFANVILQQGEDQFSEYFLYSFQEAGCRILFLQNRFSKNLENRCFQLQSEVSQTRELKQKLESQFLRTKLLNLISSKIREHIDTAKILEIVEEQLKKTVNLQEFMFIKSENNTVNYKNNIFKDKVKTFRENSFSELYVPVFQGQNLAGGMVIAKDSDFAQEEEDLIKNLSNLLSTAFNQAALFEELEMQKQSLETALQQLKNAQLQIVQSEKMATLGQLVAGVAHEINTPLGAISSNLDLVEKLINSGKDGHELINLLQQIYPVNKEAIQRIEKIVKSLKNFTRLDEAKLKKVDITEGIKSSIELVRHEAKNRVKIIENYADIPPIKCFADHINQVIMNILINAIQSIKNEGIVEITTAEKGDFISVAIKDNGEGIDPEILDRIFEFGFTTKKIGIGTGLGLSLAKKIIEDHHGEIKVYNNEGEGTTFEILLPVTC